MKTKRNPYDFKDYLDANPKLDALIKKLVTEASENLGEHGREVEAIECRSRDGFMPFSHNCGGYEYTAFDCVQFHPSYSNKEANNKIELLRKDAEEYALEKMGVSDFSKLAEDQLQTYDEHVDGYLEDDTIMLKILVMYQGIENGKHSVCVQAAINWEAPYHRSHISWMPGYKCEVFKQVEVEFKGLRDGKKKIRAALKKVKGIF